MKYNYYIDKNSFGIDPQGLKPGVRIKKVPSKYRISYKESEGPFKDLNRLRKHSSIFKELLKTDPKRAQKICEEKNIHVIKDFIFAKEGFSVNQDFINMFEHCVKGRVKNGQVTGVHFYDSKRIRILKVLQRNLLTGVWEAEIEYFDINTNKWLRKSGSTTFFPDNWKTHQLFHECKYAVDNKKMKPGKERIFESRTESGLKVEIVCVNEELKSIYPLLD